MLATCVAALASVPSGAATKPLDSAPQAKAQTELAARLTVRNQALRELARHVAVLSPTSPARDVLGNVRSELAKYQRATAGAADSTLGGPELQTLHVVIQSALPLVDKFASDPAAVNAFEAMRKVQTTQLDARNARAQLLLAQMAAIRAAAGTKGPILLVPSKPLVKKPVATRTAAREGDASTTPLQTGNEGTQATPEPIIVEVTISNDPPPTNTTFTLPSGQTVSASQAQMYAAAASAASHQGPNGGTPPTTVVINVDGPESPLFEFVAQMGPFKEIELNTGYCSPAGTGTTSSGGNAWAALFSTDSDSCEDSSKTTTASKPATCPSGTEQHVGMCYTKCRAGYKGHVTMCVYEDCPSGFRDHGLFCAKPAAYDRGAGYPWKLGDKMGSLDEARSRCARDNPGGCEKNGQIIYPKCRDGFHAATSNFCSPDCPRNFTDIGVSCKKPSYDRGVGVVKS